MSEPFGKRLRRQRHALGLTLRDTERATGVDVCTFSDIELGRGPKLTAKQFAALEPLGFDLVALMTDGEMAAEKRIEAIEAAATQRVRNAEYALLQRGEPAGFVVRHPEGGWVSTHAKGYYGRAAAVHAARWGLRDQAEAHASKHYAARWGVPKRYGTGGTVYALVAVPVEEP